MELHAGSGIQDVLRCVPVPRELSVEGRSHTRAQGWKLVTCSRKESAPRREPLSLGWSQETSHKEAWKLPSPGKPPLGGDRQGLDVPFSWEGTSIGKGMGWGLPLGGGSPGASVCLCVCGVYVGLLWPGHLYVGCDVPVGGCLSISGVTVSVLVLSVAQKTPSLRPFLPHTGKVE